RESLSVSRATPSIYSERDHLPLTPSARSSRLTALRRDVPPSPSSTAGDTTRIGKLEVDGYERATWRKDEMLEVASAGGLPKEVRQIIKESDLVTTAVSGHVDISSGFAFVVTPSSCIAWNFQKRTHSSITCYTFPAPFPTYGSAASGPPALAELYTPTAGEPGMILVSSTGQVRLWENMSVALANVERYTSIQLELSEGDIADRMYKLEGNTFIVTTILSQAIRISVSSHSGRLTANVTPFTKSAGMFARATSAIFGANERSGIRAVASSESGTFLLAGKTVQKWTLSADGQKFVYEYDLYEAVGQAVFEEEWSPQSIELEVSDLVKYGPQELIALASYTDSRSSSSGHLRPQTSHAIVILHVQARTGALSVSRVIDVDHQSSVDPRFLDIPRLLIPSGCAVAFIRLASKLIVVSLLPNAPYEDVIALKDPGRNAFIGTGLKTSSTSLTKRSHLPSLVLMPAIGGLLSVDVSGEGLQETSSTHSSPTARLKSRIEQAVFFGDRNDNPLSFDLHDSHEGDVAAAVEAVSEEILSSSSALMPTIFELRPQLVDKLHRLKELMSFVRRNGLISLLPQSSRRRLSRDAEKIRSTMELWDYQNRHMDQMKTRSPQSLLSDAIVNYMDQYSELGDGEDVVRTFFRSHIEDLDKVLDGVMSIFSATVDVNHPTAEMSEWIREINLIFVIVFRAASQYREDEEGVYEVDRLRPTVELWTAQNSLIDALERLYNVTEQLIKERSRTYGSSIDAKMPSVGEDQLAKQQRAQVVLKNQMTELAAALCTNMEDKCRTTSQRQLDEGADAREGLILNERWANMKPRIIRPLVNIDRVDEAYALAEHHSDFPTLVHLCHDPVAGAGPDRLQVFIERFGEEFAFVLYQWYIDQGQLHSLLSQDEVYGALLTKFFDIYGYPELAWMHHIACKRYGDAAIALSTVDADTESLSQKHLVSSIGKLTAVAEIKSRGGSTERKQLLLELDDELDLVKVQSDLRASLLAPSQSAPRNNRQTPLELYVATNLTKLDTRPAFRQLFSNLAEDLIEGKALDIEGLVDVLTLKDNMGAESGDCAVALERLIRDTVLPEGRKQVALLTIWRRVFVRDDWSSIANTSGRSEESQRDLVRRTLAYQTLRSLKEDFPRNFVLSPFVASQPPLQAELTARFPDWPPSDIDALMVDYEDEIEVLKSYLDGAGLERWIGEVAELVGQDLKVE
ncbi:Non-repetitive/WGA-negative nucleoporin C-terminal-domain-containing protein, partial [Naematelia encephala]